MHVTQISRRVNVLFFPFECMLCPAFLCASVRRVSVDFSPCTPRGAKRFGFFSDLFSGLFYLPHNDVYRVSVWVVECVIAMRCGNKWRTRDASSN